MLEADRQNLLKLCDLALQINAAGKYFCWYEISAHVSQVGVHLTPASDYRVWLWEQKAYFDESDFRRKEETFAVCAPKMIAVLEGALLSQGFDFAGAAT